MRLGNLVRTSSFRLTLLFAGLFLACVLVLFGAIEWYAVGSLRAELRNTISLRLAAILEDQSNSGSPDLAHNVNDAVEQNPGAYLVLQDAAGHRLAGNLASQPPRIGWLELNVPTPASATSGDLHPVFARGVRLPDGGYLLVGQDAFAVDELSELIARAFAVGTGLTLVLALAGGFFMSRRVLHRLAMVAHAGHEIMYGNLARRLPTRGTGDEFDQLVTGFNTLLDRIAELMAAMRQVTNDIAHDLRTPLTRLRTRLDELRRRPRSVAEYEAAIDRSIAETETLLDTFAALLRIAEIEAATDGETDELDTRTLIETILELYQPAAEERGQTLTGHAASVSLPGQRELLIQMLANLVENACRHSPSGARISIGAERKDGMVLLWVQDNGPGIPADERDKVFRRFYRLDISRSTPGSGLGLSLAAAIASLHRGRIQLLDASPGVRAEIRLPVERDRLRPNRQKV